jgi:predicted DNA-binding transcriptional regulator AlpA
MSTAARETETDTDRLLHAIDVSLMLGVPRATLANWRSARKGPPFVKVGRHVRYRREDVVRWVDGQVVQPGDRVTVAR